MIKACKQEELEEDLDASYTFYQDDFDKGILHSQLQTFAVHFCTMEEPGAHISIFDLKRYFLSLSPGQSALLSQVRCLLQLILVMPATNATIPLTKNHTLLTTGNTSTYYTYYALTTAIFWFS